MAFWWKRYEPILEQKPVSADEAVVDLIGKELVEMLEAFPPAESAVNWEDPVLERKLKGRLHELPKLDPAMVDVIAQLVTWDLGHEIDAIDHFLRNDRHREAATSPAHVEAMHLLWRTILEQLYQRKEETRGLLKTRHLASIMERARARFRSRALNAQ